MPAWLNEIETEGDAMLDRIQIRRTLLIGAVTCVAALSLAGSAFANGTATFSVGKLTFTAGAGDQNYVTSEYLGSTGFKVADVVPITAGTGCTQVDTYTVRCGTATTYYTTYNLGDQNDTFQSINGLPGVPTVNAGAGDDQLYGGSGKERFNGEAGNDDLDGGDNIDTLNGGANDDSVIGGAGDDVVDGGTGADLFWPGSGNDTLTYATRNNAVTVEPGSTSGESGEGDIIYPEDSFEIYTLGNGNDSTYGAWQNVGMTVNGGNGNDQIYGSNFDDTLNGDAGSDTMRGYTGNDTLRGSGGADDFRGDLGYDTVTYSNHSGGVTVTIDNVANDGHWSLDNNSDNVHTDVEHLIGSGAADSITGQVGAPTDVESLGGDDILELFDGSADSALCGSGTDSVNGDLVDTVDSACENVTLS